MSAPALRAVCLDLRLIAAGLPNLLVTPHCAWVSRGARQRLLDATVANIRGFIAA